LPANATVRDRLPVALVHVGGLDHVAVAVLCFLLPGSNLAESAVRLSLVLDKGVGSEAGDERVDVSGVAGSDETRDGGP
jgi:hypothetical protein